MNMRQPILTCFEPKIVLIFRTILGSHQAKPGKNTEINKQSAVIFWLDKRMYGSVLYSFSCKVRNFAKPQLFFQNKDVFERKLETLSTQASIPLHGRYSAVATKVFGKSTPCSARVPHLRDFH